MKTLNASELKAKIEGMDRLDILKELAIGSSYALSAQAFEDFTDHMFRTKEANDLCTSVHEILGMKPEELHGDEFDHGMFRIILYVLWNTGFATRSSCYGEWAVGYFCLDKPERLSEIQEVLISKIPEFAVPKPENKDK